MAYISLEEKHKAETLETPVSDYGAEHLNIRNMENKFHETFNPVGGRQTSWPFSIVTEELNSGVPQDNCS